MLRYNTFFYSVNWWILVLFKLSVMAGLSDSVIANAYSVQCILCILFWFNIVLSSNSPFLSVFIAFHFIIIVTVQRKFFVYLQQILLQLVKWRVEIIYLTKKDSQNEKSMPKTTAKLIIATCIAFSWQHFRWPYQRSSVLQMLLNGLRVFRFTDVTKEIVRSSDIIASSYLMFSLEEKNWEALWSRCIEV